MRRTMTSRTTGFYIRVSVTDRCNLRCRYCRPAEGPAAGASDTQPLDDETLLGILQAIGNAVPICKIRLTGGEPLVRRELPGLIEALRVGFPEACIGLTTNGTRLAAQAGRLRRAGVDAVNVSLDTTDAARFSVLTGGGLLTDVLAGLSAARAQGFRSLKLNAVLRRSGLRDMVELVRVADAHGAEARFIELMPVGAGAAIFTQEYVSVDQGLQTLRGAMTYLGPVGQQGTAMRHRLRLGSREVTVGFIAPVSVPFCGACDRLRLDARGRLYACMRSVRGVDLAARLGQGDDAVGRAVGAVVARKRTMPSAWPRRDMVAIGG